MKFSMFPEPVGFLKFMLNIFCIGKIEGRELDWCDFVEYTFNIFLCQDTCELICFKLGMMQDTTKLYKLIPVWMTLMFTQGHRKVKLVQSACHKITWSNWNIHDGWLCKGDDCEEVFYGKYGSF